MGIIFHRPGYIVVSVRQGSIDFGIAGIDLIEEKREAIRFGHILSFSTFATSPGYMAYMREAFSDERADLVRSLQEKVPAGEVLLAWIDQPFFLDYRRNAIFDAEPAGLARSWSVLPASVRYVIWEVSGFGVRTQHKYEAGAKGPGANERLISVRALQFAKQLNQRVSEAAILHFDGRYVVARLAAPSRAPDVYHWLNEQPGKGAIAELPYFNEGPERYRI